MAKPWLADLYEAHFGAVFRQCLAHLEDREEAADAAHDVFAKAAGFAAPLGPGDRSQAWLLTVARNHCIDLLRRRHRLTGALLRLQPDNDRAADPEQTTMNRDLVHAVLGPLTPRDRRLLWESAVERRPLHEIASGLRLSYLATAQALRRARKRAGAIASRVATVFGIIGVRRAGSSMPGAREALLVAAVPLIAVSLQSSPGHATAPSTAQPPLTAPSMGGIATMPLAIPPSHEVTRHHESIGAGAPTSGPLRLGATPAVVHVPQVPPIQTPVGPVNAVLEPPSLLPAQLHLAPHTVEIPPAEAALGARALAMSRT